MAKIRKPNRSNRGRGLPRGRKGKYNPGTLHRLFTALASGLTIKASCEAAGIMRSTFFAWHYDKPEFADLVHKAQTKAAPALVEIIQNHAFDDWKAAAWLLERRDRVGRPTSRPSARRP